MHFTEAISTEILLRLPLRSIARFKSVSKSWKSLTDSVYFRRLFKSLHQKSSTSWSLMIYGEELIGFHGCDTWGLQKSLAFFIPKSILIVKISSHGLVLITEYGHPWFFVGNPVLQQWIKIPPTPVESYILGCDCLVTREDDDGFLLGFKVVISTNIRATNDELSDILTVFMYSSETGIWTSKIIHCPYQITNSGFFTLNGTVYSSHLSEPGVLAAYDCYSESSDQFRIIPLPDHPNQDFKGPMPLTTSGGFVVYIRTLALSSSNDVKAWRLNNDDSSWQLLWNINLPLLIGEYVPMAMHPFDSDIVYLWSQENLHVVSCNLRTQNNRIIGDADNGDDHHQDCVLNQSSCEERMDERCRFEVSTELLQLVLPRWMELVPCPPQAEMMDTTSVLSYVTSMREEKRREM